MDKLTKRQAQIISAKTGVLACEFPVMVEYIEEKMGRPVVELEFFDDEFCQDVKKLAHEDFMELVYRD